MSKKVSTLFSLIVLLAYWLIPMRLGPVLEPVAVLAGTIAGCWLLHALLIRRVAWLRPLFGLRPAARPAPATDTPAWPAPDAPRATG